MALRRVSLRIVIVTWCMVCGIWLKDPPVYAAIERQPSFLHGVGQVVGGLVFELPKTALEATLAGPPVAGTLIGLLAGTVRALQTTFKGLQEINAAFNPWGAKK